jgi:hypothetical protein
MLLLTTMAFGYGNRENKFTVWAALHSNRVSENGEHFETDELCIPNVELIKKCPPEVKIILAFYSKQFLHADNYMYSQEIDSILAGALGDYTSLEEAQTQLLKNKEHYFENARQRELRDYPGILEIEYGKDAVCVILSGIWGSYIGMDQYRINKKGEIKYGND